MNMAKTKCWGCGEDIEYDNENDRENSVFCECGAEYFVGERWN